MTSMTSPTFQGDGSLALLNPSSIKASTRCQPDEYEFIDGRFARLKYLIADFGGHLQPVKVRRTPHETIFSAWNPDREPDGYELVFGYSRLRACLELGLPVLALIERLSEFDALRQFVFEFRGHARWRPWRLARTLNGALEAGLFRSVRNAADDLSMTVSEVKLLVELGRLPETVRSAYGNLDLTPVQANKLLRAYADSPHTVNANSRSCQSGNFGSAPAVLAALTQEVV